MLEFEFMQIDYGDISSPAEKRKIEHSVAYSLLQKMLSSHKITDYEISRNENGKPYIDGANIHFSISHTDGLCAVVLSDTEVGIDCEKIDSGFLGRVEKFSKRYFTRSEQNEIESSENKLQKFFEIWTRKEAYIKKFGLNASHISKVDTTANEYKTVYHGDYIITIFK